jgi:hypothetical protein
VTSETLSLAAAIFSAIATAFAALATWRAPTAAAKLAEALRREAEHHTERQRRKLVLFIALMQERAEIYSENAVRALNLIDVVFNDAREVREAWAELYLAFSMKPYQQHVTEERLRKLLAAIAKDIGLADELRTDDLGRVYLPTALAQERFIKDTQRQQMLASLQIPTAAAAPADTSLNTMWPPKPG